MSIHEKLEKATSTADVNVADFIQWDVRNWSASLDYWKKQSSQDLSQCSALEIGTGHGGLSLWMALQGARVTCTDLNGPQEEAINKHKSKGVYDLLKYESLDAIDIPYTNEFDVIFFKSTLGILAERDLQARAIREMHKALKPGGELLIAENLAASRLHGFLRRKFVRRELAWRYVSLEEMREFLSPFSTVSSRTVGFAGTFGRTERQRNALGFVDQVLLDRFIPERWRYIFLGVARK